MLSALVGSLMFVNDTSRLFMNRTLFSVNFTGEYVRPGKPRVHNYDRNIRKEYTIIF